MADLLTDYLRAVAGQRFAYGRLDCGLFLAGWIARARGVDPAAHLRGRYAQLCEVPQIERGLLALVSGLAVDTGLQVTRKPQRGDVAMITVQRGSDLVGAIRGTAGWHLLAAGGGLSLSRTARVIRAWSV